MNRQEIIAAINEKASAINELKRELQATDYKVTKALEWGEAVDGDTKNLRQSWRDDINQLQSEIADLEAMTPDDEMMEG